VPVDARPEHRADRVRKRHPEALIRARREDRRSPASGTSAVVARSGSRPFRTRRGSRCLAPPCRHPWHRTTLTGTLLAGVRKIVTLTEADPASPSRIEALPMVSTDIGTSVTVIDTEAGALVTVRSLTVKVKLVQVPR